MLMGLNKYAIKMIKKYQETKDSTIGSGRCKHYPSCSNYGIECYEKFNFVKASFLTLFRIMRCNPLTKKTYDPVPLSKKEKKELKDKYTRLLKIVPLINEHIKANNNQDIINCIDFIYDYTFQNQVINNESISLFYDYLYIFKQETKKKNICLNYKDVETTLNDYLSKPFKEKKPNC